MRKTAKARFKITNWNEEPYSAGTGIPKLTSASVTKTLTGDIDGEGHVEYLMAYVAEDNASLVGMERVTGTLAGKSGTFVLRRTGVYENGEAKETYTVVPGSATGELQGLKGEGKTSVGHGMEFPFELSYELD